MSRSIRILSVLTLAAVLSMPLVAQADPALWREAPEGTVKVSQFVFTRKVVKRRPVDDVSSVPVDGRRVYGFIKVFNKGPEQPVTMTWQRDGKVHLRYTLKVGRSAGWHTWSCLSASRHKAGQWTVTVEDADGGVLAQQQLLIGPIKLAKK